MPINPLSPQQIAGAQQVVDSTPDYLQFLHQCAECGLPVQERIDKANAQCEFCRKVLENFGVPQQ